MKKNARKNAVKKSRDGIIASRRTCNPNGVGLSHYILMDKKSK